MHLRLEVVQVPVSDVDRAKAFYTEQVGFALDHDVRPNAQMRVVQLTPPGSACSIVIGTGLTEMAPGIVQGLQLTVADMDTVRDALIARGVEVGEIREMGFRFAAFRDPDGNGWVLQEIAASARA